MQKQFPRIIAICGKKRSGKDTVADHVCRQFGYVKIHIANPLKQGVKVMFGFNDEQLETDLKDVVDKTWGVEPRKIMQFIGTEVMQFKINEILPNIGRTFWIKSLIEEHINNPTHDDKLYVIPDLRFYHEYELLSQYNVVFWRVERTISTDNDDAHVSEREYLDIPVSHTFKNNNRVDLYKQIDEIFKRTYF